MYRSDVHQGYKKNTHKSKEYLPTNVSIFIASDTGATVSMYYVIKPFLRTLRIATVETSLIAHTLSNLNKAQLHSPFMSFKEATIHVLRLLLTGATPDPLHREYTAVDATFCANSCGEGIGHWAHRNE